MNNRSMWMVISIVAIVAFVFWLRVRIGGLEANVAPEMETEAEEPMLVLDDVRGNLGGAIGSQAEIGFVTVAQSLGRGVFTMQIDESDESVVFPALLSRDLMAVDTQVYGQDRLIAWGHIYTLNDSIRSEWVRLEAVSAENADAIPATPSFMLVDSLSFN
ncbi:MAG: hypothetical protein ABFS14_07345 [Gemmatimonadota bacterium]